jgi:hypothetical protein
VDGSFSFFLVEGNMRENSVFSILTYFGAFRAPSEKVWSSSEKVDLTGGGK